MLESRFPGPKIIYYGVSQKLEYHMTVCHGVNGWQVLPPLLCKMEEGKIQWTDTHKIDRVRRAHPQRVTHQKARECLVNAPACTKQFELLQTYLFSLCPQGKEYAAKDCRVSRPKNESVLQCQM